VEDVTGNKNRARYTMEFKLEAVRSVGTNFCLRRTTKGKDLESLINTFLVSEKNSMRLEALRRNLERISDIKMYIKKGTQQLEFGS
jgi:hypothetical protein